MTTINVEKKPLSLYLHIPYCVQKCRYCDFCSFPRADEGEKERYVEELIRRVEAKAADCCDFTVETIYFGGGTPTTLPVSAFSRLLDVIARCYHVRPSAEITSECNPGTVDGAYLRSLRESGVNRLSVGLQSANAEELRLLGRIHTAEDFLRTVSDARDAGFRNFSADLMFGIPSQTRESFRRSLEFLLSVSPEHISAYGLKLEEGTPLYRHASDYVFPDEDEEDGMYADLCDILSSGGLSRYEISNFAKEGYHSRHNYAYWVGQDYLGFGVAAHSYFRGERIGQSRDYGAFLRGESIVSERQRIEGEELLSEYLMLRMRLECGASAAEYDRLLGRTGAFEERYGARLRAYERDGFVRRTEDGYAFTTKGFRVSNYILSELL